MTVSVIIATCNRCESLKVLLEKLRSLRISDHQMKCEILVVDNNSTDSTRQVLDDYLSCENPVFRYAFEKKQGKSYALNTGVREADGEILVFTDDDCIVDQFWIDAIAREFDSDSDLAVLGGRVELYNKQDKPTAILTGRDRIAMSSARMLFPQPMIIGCNMAIRKTVFLSVGYFDVSLGPGTRAIAEDVDLIYRAYKRGFKVVYSPSIVLYHNHGRKTDEEVAAVRRKYYIGRGAFYFKHILKADGEIAKLACRDLGLTLRRICTGRGMRSGLSFLAALSAGAISRLKSKADY